MISARAAGKLFIAGEYAIVTPGNAALIAAVDRYLTVTVTEHNHAPSDAVSDRENPHTAAVPVIGASVIDAAYGDRAELTIAPDGTATIGDYPADALSAAITVVEQLRVLQGLPPINYELRVENDLTAADGLKFGLGSSGAVIVATVAALGELHQLALTPAERFQLALIASASLSVRGSGGDIAASTFGGVIRYISPDRTQIAADYRKGGLDGALNSPGWHGCLIEPVELHSDLHFLVGWTGSPAKTEQLVAKSKAAPVDPQAEALFLAKSARAVQEIAAVLSADTLDREQLQQTVAAARSALKEYGEATGIAIETELLSALCELALSAGAAAKSSGAGGGDCGIAFANDLATRQAVIQAWEGAGITVLDTCVTRGEGVCVEF
ncbi:phosphomevalonate kinase [Canibacter zhoujuaniae]|uniref:phosphomevalonate kinase n=1 Tax=Canibacter zhoujuaniae TaxID=2708343 RepID=UPI0014202C65|nr:phosphomevalonate kinase [Canibacter zhoujuaniae]